MTILRLFTALFAVPLRSNFPENAQLPLVREWKLIGKGSFVAQHWYNNLSATDTIHAFILAYSVPQMHYRNLFQLNIQL